MSSAHKGQILPMINQMIPIDKETTFHANYDYGFEGFNQGEVITPIAANHSFHFDGQNGADISTSPISFTASDSWSAEFWIYVSVSDGQWVFFLGDATSSAKAICVSPSSNFISFRADDSSYNYGVTAIVRKKWNHVCVTYNNTLVTIYINGVKDAEFTKSSTMVFNNIGHSYPNYISVPPFEGMANEVRIWNRVISETEVKKNMNRLLSGKEEGLAGYWKLNEKEGFVAFDNSGNGNDGQWNGGITSTYARTVASKVEGKFRGAVLIEPDTINLVPAGMRTCSSVLTQQSSATYSLERHVEGREDVLRIKVAGSIGNNLYGIFGIHNVLTAVVGDVVTISFEYKIIKGTGTPDINTIYADGFKLPDTANVAVFAPAITEDIGSGWVRYSRTATINTAGNSWFRWNYFSDEMESEVVLDNFQIEKRDRASTFVDGSRPTGRLWYPKEIVNPSSFTISCWFSIPYMHRVVTNNEGINGNWYHPIIEIAGETTAIGQSFGLVAGPEPVSFSRKLQLQVPTASTVNFAIQDNVWYHMTTTYDGTTYKVYIDGDEKINAAGAPITPTDSQYLMIGGGYRGKPNIVVDELRIESRAISAEEAEAWAASGLHYNYLDYSHYVD